jgi:hypothetical protein
MAAFLLFLRMTYRPATMDEMMPVAMPINI